jgi:hypothetical protein
LEQRIDHVMGHLRRHAGEKHSPAAERLMRAHLTRPNAAGRLDEDAIRLGTERLRKLVALKVVDQGNLLKALRVSEEKDFGGVLQIGQSEKVKTPADFSHALDVVDLYGWEPVDFALTQRHTTMANLQQRSHDAYFSSEKWQHKIPRGPIT